jgi:hypothetical protein
MRRNLIRFPHKDAISVRAKHINKNYSQYKQNSLFSDRKMDKNKAKIKRAPTFLESLILSLSLSSLHSRRTGEKPASFGAEEPPKTHPTSFEKQA